MPLVYAAGFTGKCLCEQLQTIYPVFYAMAPFNQKSEKVACSNFLMVRVGMGSHIHHDNLIGNCA